MAKKIFDNNIKKILNNYKIEWLMYFAFIELGYLIVWLAFYPGISAYDTNIQVMQVMENSITTHHPVIHTLMVGLLYKIGTGLNRTQMGIDWYCLIQFTIMAIIYSYCIHYLKTKMKMACWTTILLLLFFSVFPVNSMLACSITKDSIFAALFTLWVINAYKVIENYTDRIVSYNNILFIINSILLMLFRNNALYAFFVFVFLGVFIVGKRYYKTLLSLCCSSIICFFVISSCINFLFHVEKGSPLEMLSIPVQQMARVVYYNENAWEEYGIDEFIPEETIRNYDPYLADNVKFFLNSQNIRNNKVEFIKTWIKVGMNYPIEYIKAFFIQNSGYFNPFTESYAFIYGENIEGIGYMQDKNFSYRGNVIGVEDSKLPYLNSILHKLFVENNFLKIPIIKYLFSPAFWCWTLIITFICSFKNKKNILIILFPVLYFLTLLLGPCCLIRYVYPFVAMMPIIIVLFYGNTSR